MTERRRAPRPTLVVRLSVICLFFVLWSCGASGPSGPAGQANPPPTGPPPAPPPGVPAASANIILMTTGDGYGSTESSYSPPTVLIQKNGTVSWLNSAAVTHNVTWPDATFSNTTLVPGGTLDRTFNTAGTYQFYCTLHAGMNGAVYVAP